MIVVCPFFVSRYLLTEARFSPEGRWFSRNSGCQDVAVPPQNTGVGVRCVSLLSSLHFSWAFLVGFVPLLALVFLPLQSTVVVLVILTAAIYPTTSHRRFALRALSFASFWTTLSLHHILADPLSALQHSRHTEEGRVNG
jgi:hypothetical protein